MCWSFEASLSAFLIGGGASLYLIKRDRYYLDKQIGYLMFWIILMQLFEAFIWSDQKCNGLNQLATKLSVLQSLLQPIVGYFVFKDFYIHDARKNIDFLFIIYSIAIFIYLLNVLKGKKNSFFCTKAGPNGLRWNWSAVTSRTKSELKNPNLLMYVSLAIFLIYPLFHIKKSNSTFALLILGTLLFSNYIYWDTSSIGSWWCLAAVPIPIIKIFFPALT